MQGKVYHVIKAWFPYGRNGRKKLSHDRSFSSAEYNILELKIRGVQIRTREYS
jgi:hypothetical protein